MYLLSNNQDYKLTDKNLLFFFFVVVFNILHISMRFLFYNNNNYYYYYLYILILMTTNLRVKIENILKRSIIILLFIINYRY